jgi:hypothetical protein
MWFETDVSGLPIVPTFKGQAVQPRLLTVTYGGDGNAYIGGKSGNLKTYDRQTQVSMEQQENRLSRGGVWACALDSHRSSYGPLANSVEQRTESSDCTVSWLLFDLRSKDRTNTAAWRVLWLRMWERAPGMEGSCECIEEAAAVSRQGVVLQLRATEHI